MSIALYVGVGLHLPHWFALPLGLEVGHRGLIGSFMRVSGVKIHTTHRKHVSSVCENRASLPVGVLCAGATLGG
jgi:hypothetical protein